MSPRNDNLLIIFSFFALFGLLFAPLLFISWETERKKGKIEEKKWEKECLPCLLIPRLIIFFSSSVHLPIFSASLLLWLLQQTFFSFSFRAFIIFSFGERRERGEREFLSIFFHSQFLFLLVFHFFSISCSFSLVASFIFTSFSFKQVKRKEKKEEEKEREEKEEERTFLWIYIQFFCQKKSHFMLSFFNSHFILFPTIFSLLKSMFQDLSFSFLSFFLFQWNDVLEASKCFFFSFINYLLFHFLFWEQKKN